MACFFSVGGINIIHGRHTIVPRPLILRPDFVTVGFVTSGTTTVSCTALLGEKVSVSRLYLFGLIYTQYTSKLSHGFQGLIVKQGQTLLKHESLVVL